MSRLVEIITSEKNTIRDLSLEGECKEMSLDTLLSECNHLEIFRHESDNLYAKVRALFFLYAIHRFSIPLREGVDEKSIIPYEAHEHILNRRFEEAVELLLEKQSDYGANKGISSAYDINEK